ncbi:MAG: M56 family metallopeptidase [Cyclobacteriaceae bacterium]
MTNSILYFSIYLLEVSLCLLITCLVYYFLTKKNTFYRLNRFVLIAIVLISSVLPLLHIDVSTSGTSGFPGLLHNNLTTFLSTTSNATETTGKILTPVIEEENSSQVNSMSSASHSFSWSVILLTLYLAGAFFMLARFFTGIYKIFSLRNSASYSSSEGHYITNARNQAFSFFGWIFIPGYILAEKEYSIILQHERIHSQERHSIDVFLFEIAKILLWFNPVIYFLAKESRLINEYFTDRVMTDQNGIERYSNTLFSQKVCPPIADYTISIANNFALYSLKPRVMQLIKKPTASKNKLLYLGYLPVISILFLTFSCEMHDEVTNPDKVKSIKAYFHDEYGDQTERNGSVMVNFDIAELEKPSFSILGTGVNMMKEQLEFIQWGPEVNILQFGEEWPEIRKKWSELTGEKLLDIINGTSMYVVDENGSRTFKKTGKIERELTPEGFEIVKVLGYNDKGLQMSVISYDRGELYEYDVNGNIIAVRTNRRIPRSNHEVVVEDIHGRTPTLTKEVIDRYDLTYDAAGNLVKSHLNGKLNKTFKYDEQNRLSEVNVFRNNKMARYYKLFYEAAKDISQVRAYNANEEIEYSLEYEYEYF